MCPGEFLLIHEVYYPEIKSVLSNENSLQIKSKFRIRLIYEFYYPEKKKTGFKVFFKEERPKEF